MAIVMMVTGSRNYARLPLVESVVWGLCTSSTRQADVVQLIVGDARGVDRVAVKSFEKATGRKATVYHAEWFKHGPGAGPIRNKRMVDDYIKATEENVGVFLAFWNGESTGTLGCMKYARSRGISVLIPDGYDNLDEERMVGDLYLRIWQGEEVLERPEVDN